MTPTLNVIYVVLSRDKSNFIYCTTDLEKAKLAKKMQEEKEEMEGGRPSVYFKETLLHF